MSDFSHLSNDLLSVFDCREASLFIDKHFHRSVNIPANDLFLRMHELPIKSESFCVIVDSLSQQQAKRFFDERNFSVAEYFLWDDVCEQLSEKYFCSGKSEIYFWQPAPFVKTLESYLVSQKNNSVLDVACGSGRDSVYLAMQGFQVFGIDYSETALERCRTTAKHYDVTVQLAKTDLENQFTPEALNNFPNHFSAVVVCRYLHRPLFDQLKQWVEPGGLIAYQTFMKGSELIGSPRNPNFLLQEGELAGRFSEFDILLNDVHHLPDGRPMSQFIARKPTL